MLEDNIKMGLTDMGCERMEWIKLTRNRFQSLTPVDTEVKIQVPRKVDNLLITRTLILATIYLQLVQNRYMFQSFTVLQCSHQHCVQPVASDVEVVGYL